MKPGRWPARAAAGPGAVLADLAAAVGNGTSAEARAAGNRTAKNQTQPRVLDQRLAAFLFSGLYSCSLRPRCPNEILKRYATCRRDRHWKDGVWGLSGPRPAVAGRRGRREGARGRRHEARADRGFLSR